MERTERGGGRGKMVRSLPGQIWGQKEENGAGHGVSE